MLRALEAADRYGFRRLRILQPLKFGQIGAGVIRQLRAAFALHTGWQVKCPQQSAE